MAKKESAQIKSSNPFYELIKVYSAHQVTPGKVVGGVPILWAGAPHPRPGGPDKQNPGPGSLPGK